MEVINFTSAQSEDLPEFLFTGLTQDANELNKKFKKHLSGKTIKAISIKQTEEECLSSFSVKPAVMLEITFEDEIFFSIELNNENPWKVVSKVGFIDGIKVGKKEAHGAFLFTRKKFSLYRRIRFFFNCNLSKFKSILKKAV